MLILVLLLIPLYVITGAYDVLMPTLMLCSGSATGLCRHAGHMLLLR